MPEPCVVHCPAKIAHLFGNAAAIDPSDHLDLTSSRDEAEAYVRERYRGQEEARYGLLASSKARLSDYGRCAEWQAIRWLRAGPWF